MILIQTDSNRSNFLPSIRASIYLLENVIKFEVIFEKTKAIAFLLALSFTNKSRSLSVCYKVNEEIIKRKHNQRIKEFEHSSFSLLVFSFSSGYGPIASLFIMQLSLLHSENFLVLRYYIIVVMCNGNAKTIHVCHTNCMLSFNTCV